MGSGLKIADHEMDIINQERRKYPQKTCADINQYEMKYLIWEYSGKNVLSLIMEGPWISKRDVFIIVAVSSSYYVF